MRSATVCVIKDQDDRFYFDDSDWANHFHDMTVYAADIGTHPEYTVHFNGNILSGSMAVFESDTLVNFCIWSQTLV